MKTINDLFTLGRTEPVVNSYLTLYEKKEITLEEALIGMVFTLREQKNEVTENFIKHLERCNTPAIKP